MDFVLLKLINCSYCGYFIYYEVYISLFYSSFISVPALVLMPNKVKGKHGKWYLQEESTSKKVELPATRASYLLYKREGKVCIMDQEDAETAAFCSEVIAEADKEDDDRSTKAPTKSSRASRQTSPSRSLRSEKNRKRQPEENVPPTRRVRSKGKPDSQPEKAAAAGRRPALLKGMQQGAGRFFKTNMFVVFQCGVSGMYILLVLDCDGFR